MERTRSCRPSALLTAALMCLAWFVAANHDALATVTGWQHLPHLHIDHSGDGCPTDHDHEHGDRHDDGDHCCSLGDDPAALNAGAGLPAPGQHVAKSGPAAIGPRPTGPPALSPRRRPPPPEWAALTLLLLEHRAEANAPPAPAI